MPAPIPSLSSRPKAAAGSRRGRGRRGTSAWARAARRRPLPAAASLPSRESREPDQSRSWPCADAKATAPRPLRSPRKRVTIGDWSHRRGACVMINEFKQFIFRGNVLDLAVGIIIGAAFTAIVSSLVDDIIMPPIGLALGGVDFSQLVRRAEGRRHLQHDRAGEGSRRSHLEHRPLHQRGDQVRDRGVCRVPAHQGGEQAHAQAAPRSRCPASRRRRRCSCCARFAINWRAARFSETTCLSAPWQASRHRPGPTPGVKFIPAADRTDQQIRSHRRRGAG